MFYTELTFHISPYVEDIADAIIAELGDLGYDSFSYSDDGFKAYIPSKNFDEEQVKYDTFIAEFFDSNICFADTSTLAQAAPTLPYNVLVTRLRVCFFMPEKAEERLDNRH